ncbi:hypothetical protein DIS24_g12163 [Lasiodiplodia hormozganensis]|uniref:Uncharacterized protein n=1 Tax=Lasiodiplodia hormozganensis TaxID=869390 RepID=A0AA39W400_9PEZI|nr:hypothetical protein DIS24_g12163 [Lasiodiplodia hormozganensis]
MRGHPTITLLLLLLAQQCIASTNSFYFSFPSKTEDVPLVHNGDTLNVTWFSEYNQAVLNFWCGTTQLEVIDGLSGNGNRVYTVNTTWTGKCHWQLAQQDDADRYVDSGFVDVTNAKVTPALLWKPSAAGTACSVAATSSSSLASSTAAAATTSASPVITNFVVATQTAACAEGDGAGVAALSPGASMGVGVGIGAVVTGVITAVVWLCAMRRRKGREGEEGQGNVRAVGEAQMDGGPVEYREYPVVHELNPMNAYVEADWSHRKSLMPVELPQTPVVRR